MQKIYIDSTYKIENPKVALNGNAVYMCLSNNPCGIGRQKSQLTKGLLINHPAVERKTECSNGLVHSNKDGWFAGNYYCNYLMLHAF